MDLGDNFVSPDLLVDEDFFYCRIQPEVLNLHSCASGQPGEAGTCHASRSGLRLDSMAEMETIDCVDGAVVGPIPASYEANLANVRFSIQSDPLSSPIYRRPLGLDSHPRRIYEDGSECERLVFDWLTTGAM